MSMRVRCDFTGCQAEADAVMDMVPWHDSGGTVMGHAPVARTPYGTMGILKDGAFVWDGWSDNNGLGGVFRHYCPAHRQAEIAGG